jgi:hypothetical protein
MTMLLFYRKPVLLDRERHAELKLDRGAGYGFARSSNSVMLSGEEFAAASASYPVVFVDIGGGRLFPVALLGLRARENLFVRASGAWEAGRYVPAFVRRYPFVLTDDQNVCFDEAAPALKGRKGEPLFAPDGASTPVLAETLAFLSAYQRTIDETQRFVDRLSTLALLKPIALQVAVDADAPFRLKGLHVVDEAALNALQDEALLPLFRAGWLGWIHAHLTSLARIDDLGARSRARAPAQAA